MNKIVKNLVLAVFLIAVCMLCFSSCEKNENVVLTPSEEHIVPNEESVMKSSLANSVWLATNVAHYQTFPFTASGNTTYHVGIDPTRVMYLYFYVQNTSYSQIRVERWLGGSLYDSKVVTNGNSPVNFNWTGINASYNPVEFRIINNNSSSISNMVWTANFIDE
jgi:hypothetical protein